MEVLSASTKDAGTYVVKAVNSAGEAECSATVTVEGELAEETFYWTDAVQKLSNNKTLMLKIFLFLTYFFKYALTSR